MKLRTSFVRTIAEICDRVLTITNLFPARLVESLGIYLAVDELVRGVLEKKLSWPILEWLAISAAFIYLLIYPAGALLRWLAAGLLGKVLARSIQQIDPIQWESVLGAPSGSERLNRLTELLGEQIGLKNAQVVASRIIRQTSLKGERR